MSREQTLHRSRDTGDITVSSQSSQVPDRRALAISHPCNFSNHGATSPVGSSVGPGSEFGAVFSPDIPDRVFPIRSAVNIARHPSQRSASSWNGSVTEEMGHISNSRDASISRRSSFSADPGAERRLSISSSWEDSEEPRTARSTQETEPSRCGTFRDTSVVRGTSGCDGNEGGDDNDNDDNDNDDTLGGYMSVRHRHTVTAQGHMVITGISGAEKIQRCEDEPIHIPGAIQGFGVLVALKESADSRLEVRVASENSERIIGHSPSALFALMNFCDILSDEQAENLLDHIEFFREDFHDPTPTNPEVFSLIIIAPDSTEIKLWCAMHISDLNKDLIICEFELEDDRLYPLTAVAEQDPSSPPASTLQSEPTEQELLDSTLSKSRPLRILKKARERRGDATAMEVFNLMNQIQEQLASANNLELFLKVVVGVIKELTGFHRVMIYQFDSDWNGKIVAELVDPRATKDLYKGLNFPASDIPQQARDLYKVNKVRLLYDRDQKTARLVCKTLEDLEKPLDMTHSYLRAMSPIHLKYLANMAVRASMSISITAFGQLWGLVSCHSYGKNGMRVSFPIRKMCRLIGETASCNIERLAYTSRLQARKLINTVPTETNPSGYIVASSEDLLSLFDADFGLLSIKNETKILGKLEGTQEALAMLEYLRMKKFMGVLTSQELKADFSDLDYAPGFSVIAGLLLVPLSAGGSDFIVFFRKGQLKCINWAGNPYEKTLREGTDAILEPRKSFKIWSETIVGKSKDWTEEQIETASVLCLVYGKFIEVWRQKEAALRTSQLTKLLLANASHEVRTPLNAIINYLEIALEGPLDSETRDNLSKSHSASKSLIYVINDLLDLTRTEEGHDLFREEVFDLSETIHEASMMFKPDAERKNIQFEVTEYPGVPDLVKGDQTRIRQVVSNIAGNAVKHTLEGGVKIEIYASPSVDDRCDIEIAIEDTGIGMSADKLDMLFRELEQVQTEDEQDVSVSKSSRSTFDALSKISGQKALGLGLAVVARIVRNMNGHLRLKSEPGKGSRFTIHIPLSLPQKETSIASTSTTPPLLPSPAPGPASLPPSAEQQGMKGEILLVEFSSSARRRPSVDLERRNTGGSVRSFRSQSTGGSAKCEIDRLVNAISSPHIHSFENSPKPSPARSPALAPPELVSMAHASSHPGASKSTPAPISRLQKAGVATRAGSVAPLRVSRAPPVEPATFASPIPKRANTTLLPGKGSSPSNSVKFDVLVAEDDPINRKIIKKRLEKMGHAVSLTVNGEECATLFKEMGEGYDVLLMDMQMPIMDGGTSTALVRKHESDPTRNIPAKHISNGRVAIFAVSASLVEERRQEYIDLGFDGWILKPVDFKRLGILMEGIVNPEIRKSAAYVPGEWEKGGWFSGDNERVHIQIGGRQETEPESGPKSEFELKPPSKPGIDIDETSTHNGHSMTAGITLNSQPQLVVSPDPADESVGQLATDRCKLGFFQRGFYNG